MENAVEGLFTTSFLVFALVIALLVIVIRTFAEAAFKKLQFIIPDKYEQYIVDFWREWVLRGLPVVLGGLMAILFSQYPFPAPFDSSISGSVFFGVVAGLFSSTIYSFVKFHIKKYLPEDIKKKIKNLNPMPQAEEEDDNK